MPRFEYKAIDSKGKEITSFIEAANTQEAISKIKEKGYYVLNLEKTETETYEVATPVEERGSLPKRRGLSKEITIPFLGIGTVKTQDLAIFTRQLATMINAGLPLVRSLNVLYEQLKAGPLRDIIKSLSDEVTSGGTLSDALSRYPKVFSPLYVNMIKAGESGGVLEIVLERLAGFIEKNVEVVRKIKSALTYPALVVIFAAGVLVFMVGYLIPKFIGIYESLGMGNLPTITQMVLSLSRAFQERWYVGLGFIVGIFLVYKLFYSLKRSRLLIDKLKLRLPIIGELLRKIEVTRFSRTLGTLISSGVPILQALRITRGIVKNSLISQAIGKVHDSIREGESIAGPLKASGVFPLMVVNMIDVGEETGSLDEMFVKVADIYDNEVDNTINALTSLLEPALIVTIGVIVLFIVISLFSPLVTLMTRLGSM